MTKILIGSTYFFHMYPDFNGKDIDELELVTIGSFKQMRQITGQGKCLFQLKKHITKEDYIEWALQSELGMVLGKFLIPEFCNMIGFTISDLVRLQPLVERLDDKHKYEQIIYESYLVNNDFILTNAQRNAAYASYKMSRNL